MSTIQWFQRADVREFHRTQAIPGDRTSYVDKAPSHAGPNDRTDFQVGHATYHARNLPDFIYELHPPQSWLDYQAMSPPKQKKDANGRLMFEVDPRPGKDPRPILDFPHLAAIDKVCTYESWLWWEMNMRLDPHFRYEDGIMRMPMTGLRASFQDEAHFRNNLNMAMVRNRKRWSLASWRDPRNGVSGPRERLVKDLSRQQIRNNTTRGSTPGLIDPSLGEVPKNRIPIPAESGPRGRRSQLSKGRGGPMRATRSSSEADAEVSDYDESMTDANSSEEDFGMISASAAKPQRGSQSRPHYVVDDGEEGEDDSDVSEYEPEPRPSKSGKSRNLPPANNTLPKYPDTSKSRKTKRPRDAEEEEPINKKLKSSKDKEVDADQVRSCPSQPPREIHAKPGIISKSGKTKRPRDAEEDEPANKKPKSSTYKEVHATRLPPSPSQPPRAIFSKPGIIIKPRSKHVGKVLDNRQHRSSPQATSSTLPKPYIRFSDYQPPVLPYHLDAATGTLMADDGLQSPLPQSAASMPPPPLPLSAVIAKNLQQTVMEEDQIFEEEQQCSSEPLFPDPASWSKEWKAFICDHDAEPLLKAAYPYDWPCT